MMQITNLELYVKTLAINGRRFNYFYWMTIITNPLKLLKIQNIGLISRYTYKIVAILAFINPPLYNKEYKKLLIIWITP